jgi:antirestriction protein
MMNFSELSEKNQKAIAKDTSYDLESLIDEDPYMIKAEDWDDYADELFEECYLQSDDESMKVIASYIDWEKWRRDLEYDYTYTEDADGDAYYLRSF